MRTVCVLVRDRRGQIHSAWPQEDKTFCGRRKDGVRWFGPGTRPTCQTCHQRWLRVRSIRGG